MTKQQIITVFMMMLITSALVSGSAVFGGIWYLKHAANADTSSGTFLSFLTEREEPRSPMPTFHSLDKVVLSVKGQKQNHFVMLEIAVKTHHPERIQAIDDYMPVVRNTLLKLFSNKTYEDLYGEDAITQLQKEVKKSILVAFENTEIARDIDDVLLTKYVVQ